MKAVVFILGALLFLSSCVTQKKVEQYADKHPERMADIAWDYMDKYPQQSMSYCITKYPTTPTGTSTETEIDSAAMEDAIGAAIADAIDVNDSIWYAVLGSEYIHRDTVARFASLLKGAYEKRVEKAVRKAVGDCDRYYKTIVRDTVIDNRQIEYWKGQYNQVANERDLAAGVAEDVKKDNEQLKSSLQKWKFYSIGIAALILLIIIVIIVYKLKSKPFSLDFLKK